jgi:hypothetical protein
MLRSAAFIAALAIAAASASSSLALCSGGTVEQEYRDATIVVRARVVSQTDAFDVEPSKEFVDRWGDEGLTSLYTLKVLEVFKGAPPSTVNIFMPHNSGAFYVDLGKDYLLFLNRIPARSFQASAAAGAFGVSYACGQSKPWAEVQGSDLTRLRQIARR